MDYEKKYKEALSWIKDVYPTFEGATKKDAEHFFPELRESEDEKIRKEIISALKFANVKGVYDKHIAWLEKQGKQNPTNKVESKFHEGDWVVHTATGIVHQIKHPIENVTNKTYGYDLIDGGYISSDDEVNYHLWTITDAKDGDVLSDGTTIFIFKELLSDGSVMSYCDYDTDSGESDAFYPLSMNLMCSKINPATKEQRGLLLQKMHDEGYEWNAEKRELKKIEQKYAWSEEDENMLKSIIATCKLAEQDRDSSPARHLFEMQDNWLKSLKERIKGE